MKKILSGLLALCLLLCLGGCQFWEDVEAYTSGEEKPKTFQWDGISIELTTRFVRLDFMKGDYDFVVGNETLTIIGTKVPHEETDRKDLSVAEFAEHIHSQLEPLNPSEIRDVDDIPVIQYHDSNGDEQQTAAMMFYKGEDCFWVVYFAALAEDFEKTYDDICKYAKTVTVT